MTVAIVIDIVIVTIVITAECGRLSAFAKPPHSARHIATTDYGHATPKR